VIVIIPERMIGMPRNTDRHRPESPRRFAILQKIQLNPFASRKIATISVSWSLLIFA
jgi:hypothetical protein